MNRTSRLLRSLCTSYVQRAYSSKLPQELVFPLGEKMIVCWHPEKQFPYEHSLPLPEEIEDESVLNMELQKAKELLTPETRDEIVSELAKITHTTKHRWYPRSRDKKAKATVPDRPYL